MKHLPTALVPLCLALTACGTDAGPEPNVTVKSATPDELVVSNDLLDDVTITVEYDDGDGDLGEGLALVYDCRGDGLVTALVLPAIAPDDVVADGTHITGTLELHVNDVGLIAPGPQPAVCADLGVAALAADQTVFCVVLEDAAGHEGGGDCTAVITLFE